MFKSPKSIISLHIPLILEHTSIVLTTDGMKEVDDFNPYKFLSQQQHVLLSKLDYLSTQIIDVWLLQQTGTLIDSFKKRSGFQDLTYKYANLSTTFAKGWLPIAATLRQQSSCSYIRGLLYPYWPQQRTISGLIKLITFPTQVESEIHYSLYSFQTRRSRFY